MEIIRSLINTIHVKSFVCDGTNGDYSQAWARMNPKKTFSRWRASAKIDFLSNGVPHCETFRWWTADLLRRERKITASCCTIESKAPRWILNDLHAASLDRIIFSHFTHRSARIKVKWSTFYESDESSFEKSRYRDLTPPSQFLNWNQRQGKTQSVRVRFREYIREPSLAFV